jgi:DNA-binding response OmpR family regulator
VLRFGRLRIDRQLREVYLDAERKELTSRQFDLLVLLAERAGRIQSREQIMEALRGEQWDAFDRSIDVHISRIRTAIEADPKHPRFVQTVRGAGYVFTPPRAGGEQDQA